MKPVSIARWILRAAVAVVLLFTLLPKLMGEDATIAVFETVGQSLGMEGLMEPWGRYATATAEMVAALFILIPGTAVLGAVIASLVVIGALYAHLCTPLGISVAGDGGMMFILAVVVLAACVATLFLKTQES